MAREARIWPEPRSTLQPDDDVVESVVRRVVPQKCRKRIRQTLSESVPAWMAARPSDDHPRVVNVRRRPGLRERDVVTRVLSDDGAPLVRRYGEDLVVGPTPEVITLRDGDDIVAELP